MKTEKEKLGTAQLDFIHFLKEADVLRDYLHNFYADKIEELYESAREFLTINNPDSYIYGAFRWSATTGGQIFWQKLDAEWTKQNMKQDAS